MTHRSPRFSFACFFSALVLILTIVASANAQSASTNVNMVSGTGWPTGDPFLQRQDEPSLSVSTRNPLHLLAGANDYRTVDLPGLADGKVIGDAWLGLFKSRDGGLRWNSTLLPGYPQDSSPEGLASPIKGLTSAADPIVRAGTNGLFFFGGIAFNRASDTAPNKLFVARFLDKNNRENGDTIKYVSTVAVQTTTPGDFADKPWLATDIPRSGAATCNVDGESFKGGNVYLAWTLFSNGETQGKILFSRSTNCGASWSTPIILSTGQTLAQGATLAVSPLTGYVYVAWRRFIAGTQTDAIFVARSTNGGSSFGAPVQVASLPANNLFDQGTTGFSFRTNSYPTMTIDLLGRIYLAWSQRNVGPGNDARVVLTTSLNGTSWTTPAPVENHAARGHQIMPTLSMSVLKLMLAYYDLREDSTIGIYQRAESGAFVETRQKVGDLSGTTPNIPNVFNSQIMDAPATIKRRHTMDVRLVQANPAATPTFTPSVRVTQYDYGSKPGSNVIEQLEFNPPNLPMFKLGTAAFFGDYIDLAATLISPTLSGSWSVGDLSLAGGAHVAWTDNRNVQPPPPGKTWANYTPPISVFAPAGSTSIFDPTQTRPICGVETPGYTTAGMRNQNIYTSRITQGLYVGVLGNTKPLSGSLQRAFAMFAQNNLSTTKHYRLTITNQPTGGKASFLPTGATRTTLDVSIAAYSSIARSVFVTSTNAKAKVLVLVQQITAPGGTLVSGGLQSGLMLNPDSDNPPLTNPENPTPGNPSIATAEAYNVTIGASEIRNPEIANPEIANPEIANPEIFNPEIANPEIANPEIANPEIANPEIANPEIANPEIANPEIANPEIANPEIANPEIANGSMTDASWSITNTGNTAATYNIKLVSNQPAPVGMKFQLLVYWTYTTPVAKNCTLTQETNYVLQANIINPTFLTSTANLINQAQDITNSSVQNVTIALEPGQTAKITLRAVGASKAEVVNYLTTNVKPAAVAQAANTGTATPQSSVAALGVATSVLPAGVISGAYSANLLASGGTTPYSWSLDSSTLPAGLTLSAAGVISGAPTVAGLSTFTVRVTDSASQTATRTLSIQVKATATALLSFSNQPINTVVNQPIPPGTGVRVLAMQGVNPVPGLNITLAIGNNPGGGTLTGFTTIVTDANGIAAFPNLRINAAGVGYTLVASASGAAQITSNAFNVAAGTNLSFVFQPRGFVANTPLPIPLQVQATDAASAVLPGVSVTLALGVNPSGATLSGTLVAITDATGIAYFPGVTFDRGGFNYLLQATAPGGAITTSQLFHVEGFALTGSGCTPRYNHTATLLPNGKVLIAGSYEPTTTDSAELYDPTTGTFTPTGSMVAKRYVHTATLLPNGKVLMAGGYDDTLPGGADSLASAELYDPATGTFTATGSMSVKRYFPTATLLPNGRVLIAGGGESIGINTAEIYDPATGLFSPVSNTMSDSRFGHTATLLPNGKVLLTGGSLGVISADLYDPATNSFTPTGSLTVDRIFHTATLLANGKVLIVGGSDFIFTGYTTRSSAELYDPATGLFSATGSMLVPRERHLAALLPNGTVLVAGGLDLVSGNSYFTAEIFDPATGGFSPTDNMEFRRGLFPTSTLLSNGTVLIVGGNEPVSASAELFYPLSPPFPVASFSSLPRYMPVSTPYRISHAATLLPNGKVLLSGGTDAGAPVSYDMAHLFDSATETFADTGTMNSPRYAHLSILLPNGKVLIAGGHTGVAITESAELYDPLTGLFTLISSMSVKRAYPTATLLPNGKVLIAGGVNVSGSIASAELFDPATNTFSATIPMPARADHTATLLSNGKVLIAGGFGAVTLSSAQLYDPATNTFSATGSLSVARYYHKAVLMPDGKVLIAGGQDVSSIGSAEIYDPTAGTFSLTGSLATPCHFHNAVLLTNGKVMMEGGYNTATGQILSSVELFDPATGTFGTTASMGSGRYQHHTLTLLPTGKVLVTGGHTVAPPVGLQAELYSPGQ